MARDFVKYLVLAMLCARVASAGVEASYRAEVQAPHADVTSRVAGEIKRVAVHDRQLVAKGDVLIELDDDDLQAHLIAAKADLAARQAELAVKQVELATAKAKKQPRTELEQANVDLADARVKQAEAALDLAQLDLQHATIRAELSGTISLGGLAAGQIVQRLQTLATIVDADHAWVDAFFAEPQLAHVAVGQAADIAIAGASLHGTVGDIDRDGAAMVHTIADPTGGRVGVRVEIRLADKHPPVWPGTTATVRVHTP